MSDRPLVLIADDDDDVVQLLKIYLRCELTPDDPPREQAEKLLKQVTSGV